MGLPKIFNINKKIYRGINSKAGRVYIGVKVKPHTDPCDQCDMAAHGGTCDRRSLIDVEPNSICSGPVAIKELKEGI